MSTELESKQEVVELKQEVVELKAEIRDLSQKLERALAAIEELFCVNSTKCKR